MRYPMLISAGLHIAVLTLAYFELPALLEPDPSPPPPVVVDLVDMAALADKPEAPRAAPRPAAEPEPPAQRQAPPARSEPPPALAPPPPPPSPPDEVVKVPEPPAAKQKPKPKVEHKAKPVPRPKPEVKVARLAPKPKPKPKPKPPPDAFETLLKNLAKQAQRSRRRTPPQEQEVAKREPEAPAESPIDRQRLRVTLVQMVIQQITPCWSIPAGAKDAQTMQVGIEIALNPDGTLRGLPRIKDQARMARDPFFRAIAESALRALRDPRCSPLRLPIKNFDTWKEISFNFDPRDALGR